MSKRPLSPSTATVAAVLSLVDTSGSDVDTRSSKKARIAASAAESAASGTSEMESEQLASASPPHSMYDVTKLSFLSSPSYCVAPVAPSSPLKAPTGSSSTLQKNLASTDSASPVSTPTKATRIADDNITTPIALAQCTSSSSPFSPATPSRSPRPPQSSTTPNSGSSRLGLVTSNLNVEHVARELRSEHTVRRLFGVCDNEHQRNKVCAATMDWFQRNPLGPNKLPASYDVRVNATLRQQGVKTVKEHQAKQKQEISESLAQIRSKSSEHRAAFEVHRVTAPLVLDESVMESDTEEETDPTIAEMMCQIVAASAAAAASSSSSSSSAATNIPKPLWELLHDKLNLKQREIFDCIRNGESVFITGAAGCGKSFLVRTIIEWLKHAKYNQPCKQPFRTMPVAKKGASGTADAVAASPEAPHTVDGEDREDDDVCQCFHCKVGIVGPTGLSILPLRGRTINSFFGVGIGSTLGEWDKKATSFHAKRMRSIDILFCEEVSMVSAETLDLMDMRMRMVRNEYHQSFGGVRQLIFLGDFFQLPPVTQLNPIVEGDEDETNRKAYEKYEMEYKTFVQQLHQFDMTPVLKNLPFWHLKRALLESSPGAASVQRLNQLNVMYLKLKVRNWGYSFQSNVWRAFDIKSMQLVKQQRQQSTDVAEDEFIQRLAELRVGDVSNLNWFIAHNCVLMRPPTARPPSTASVSATAAGKSRADVKLHLMFTNSDVNWHNAKRLREISDRGEPAIEFPVYTLTKRVSAELATGLEFDAELLDSAVEDRSYDYELEQICSSDPIHLCIGAPVLLTRNLDLRPNSSVMLANSSRGVVSKWRSKEEVAEELSRFIANMEAKMGFTEDAVVRARQEYFISTLRKKLELAESDKCPNYFPVVRFTQQDESDMIEERDETILPSIHELRDAHVEIDGVDYVQHKWRLQLPLKLAWATTIHKSQGMTLDDVLIDNRMPAFSFGQLYVALSRVKSHHRLQLTHSLGHLPQRWASAVAQEYANGTLQQHPIDWIKDPMTDIAQKLRQGQ